MSAGSPVPGWLSELAEELAPLAAAMDGVGLNRRILEEAGRHGYRGWQLTLAIAREWDRMGIIRVHAGAGPMGV